MCDPVSITSLAISAAAAAASAKAQADQAKAAAKYQNTVAQQTGQIAQGNYLQQTAVAGTQQVQGQLQAGQAIRANQVAGLQAQGTANAAAAESGVGGNSVSELLADFKRQEANASDALRTNQSFANEQIVNQEQGLQAQAMSRIAGSQPGPISGANYLATGLTIGGAALSAYDSHLYRTQTGPYNPNGNLQQQGAPFRPLPFLNGVQPKQGVFSS